MLPIHLGLVSDTDAIKLPEVTRVAAALQKQALRDFGPLWHVHATVSAFDRLEDVPVDYWPMIIEDNIHHQGAAGIHLDKDGQPFALIQVSDSWSLTASHECLEMLADPFGSRLVSGTSPKRGEGRVAFLVEVCDPCEDAKFSYTVNGVIVSDFYTPNYFDPTTVPTVRYSYTGSITAPRQVLKGGYLSWFNPVTRHWAQERFFGNKPNFVDLGIMSQATGSLREFVDSQTPHPQLVEGLGPKNTLMAAVAGVVKDIDKSTYSKADAWRQQIKALKAQK